MAKRSILITLCVTSFLVPYMGSSLNLALPQIAEHFHLDAKELGWLNSAFLIATAILQVPFAKISDLIGRKKIFFIGVGIFGVFSVASGFASSFTMMLVFRAFAGLGGAMVFGTNMAIISATYPPNERGRAMGIMTSVVYAALATGPFLGGLLTHYFGWQSVFWIPGTILILQAAAIPFFIRTEWIEDKGGSFDKRGAFIYGLSVFCLIYGFSELPKLEAAILIFSGAIGLCLFYKFEKQLAEPMFQVSLFGGNKVFTLASLSAFFSYAATSAVTFMISLYLQYVRGFEARAAGLILVSSAAVQSVAALQAGKLADKYSPQKIAMLGMAFNAIGLFGLVFVNIETDISIIIAMLLFLGLGFGLFASPNTKVIMGSVERKQLSQASAVIGTMRLTGQAFSMGIAMMAISLFVGDNAITAKFFDSFAFSMRLTFAIFAFLCLLGVYASSVYKSSGADNQHSE